MGGALVQLLANETFEDQQDFQKGMALAGIGVFSLITFLWLYLATKYT